MKNWWRKPMGLFFLAIKLCCIGVLAQTPQEGIAISAKFIEQKAFDKAIEMAERALFFTTNPAEKALCYYYIGVSHWHNARVEQANVCFLNALYLTIADTIAHQCHTYIAAGFILQNQPQEAIYHLNQVPSTLNAEIWPYKCIAFLQLGKYDSCQVYLNSYGQYEPAETKKIIRKYESTQRLNPTKGAIFSCILPGSGQIYGKNVPSGVHSFLLLSALSGLAVWSIAVYSPLDAVLWVGPWWIKYYTGGINRTKWLIQQHKTEATRQLWVQLFYKNHP